VGIGALVIKALWAKRTTLTALEGLGGLGSLLAAGGYVWAEGLEEEGEKIKTE